MSSIVWDNATPTASSLATSMDDEIRQSMTTIATGLGTSFYGPGSAASQGASTSSTGELLLGTARVARGAIENGDSGYSGFLGFGTRSGGFYELGNAARGSRLLGHAQMLHRSESKGNAPFTARWVHNSGSQSLSGALTYAETVTHGPSATTGYNGNPAIFVCPSSASFVVGIHSVSTLNFVSVLSYIGPTVANAAVTLYWHSEGTVSY